MANFQMPKINMPVTVAIFNSFRLLCILFAYCVLCTSAMASAVDANRHIFSVRPDDNVEAIIDAIKKGPIDSISENLLKMKVITSGALTTNCVYSRPSGKTVKRYYAAPLSTTSFS